VEPLTEADEHATRPSSFIAVHPDSSPTLVDQRVSAGRISVFFFQYRLDLLSDSSLDQTVGFLFRHVLRVGQDLHEDGGHVSIAGRHVAAESDLARTVDQDDDRIIIHAISLSRHAARVALDPHLVEREDQRGLRAGKHSSCFFESVFIVGVGPVNPTFRTSAFDFPEFDLTLVRCL
jgi:hypothetical protein